MLLQLNVLQLWWHCRLPCPGWHPTHATTYTTVSRSYSRSPGLPRTPTAVKRPDHEHVVQRAEGHAHVENHRNVQELGEGKGDPLLPPRQHHHL